MFRSPDEEKKAKLKQQNERESELYMCELVVWIPNFVALIEKIFFYFFIAILYILR